METRTLGSTGLVVSRIGLGLAALGRPGYINLGHAEDLAGQTEVPQLRARTHTVLDVAWQHGIRYFDAARSYGRAEEFLGSWLQSRTIPPGRVTIGSKWGYVYTAGWRAQAEVHEVKDHSLELFKRQLAESRAALGPYLRLYQIHSATLESGVLENRALLVALAGLKAEGIALGLSTSGPQQAEVIRRGIEIVVEGQRLFDAVQVTWNLLERSATDSLRQAHAAGMGVIIKEALANGRLTARNEDPSFVTQRRALERQAARRGATLDALALAAVLAQPWADVVLSGAATADQLRSNLRALDVAWDEEAASELAGLVEPPSVYWETRKELPWN